MFGVKYGEKFESDEIRWTNKILEGIKLTLKDIIKIYDKNHILNFDGRNIKLVRHKDSRLDFKELIKKGLLEEYQSYQTRNVFKDCSYIVVFIADEGQRSLLTGIYEVKEKYDLEYFKTTNKLKKIGLISDGNRYKYKLELIPDFKELYNRVVIDWGKATIAWHQWASNQKEIIEIYPEGYISEFPGYLRFILDYKDLEKLIKNKDANKVWHKMLSSVYGVYLILDRKSGKQYVGSAYGQDNCNGGILGRWTTYVKNKMDVNNKLTELVKDDEKYKYNFSFTILEIMSKSTKDSEVIAIENLYKDKLGTKKFGLNSN